MSERVCVTHPQRTAERACIGCAQSLCEACALSDLSDGLCVRCTPHRPLLGVMRRALNRTMIRDGMGVLCLWAISSAIDVFLMDLLLDQDPLIRPRIDESTSALANVCGIGSWVLWSVAAILVLSHAAKRIVVYARVERSPRHTKALTRQLIKTVVAYTTSATLAYVLLTGWLEQRGSDQDELLPSLLFVVWCTLIPAALTVCVRHRSMWAACNPLRVAGQIGRHVGLYGRLTALAFAAIVLVVLATLPIYMIEQSALAPPLSASLIFPCAVLMYVLAIVLIYGLSCAIGSIVAWTDEGSDSSDAAS